jgi:maltose alpha-D-glucosyltransferase/alpha-amylase
MPGRPSERRGRARPILLASADHDFSRLACGTRTAEQLGAAFTFLLTWGSVPSIYYGDEIGQRYQPGLPNVEGSEIYPDYYNRAGCRTPMQWDGTANAGFSTAPAHALYLPFDPSPDRSTVAGQLADPDSVLHLVRNVIALRRAHPALGARASTRVLNAGYPFVYLRDEAYLVVVNPRRSVATFDLTAEELVGGGLGDGGLGGGALSGAAEDLLSRGVVFENNQLHVSGFGYGIFRLPTL